MHQGIFSFRPRSVSDFSILDRDLQEFPWAGNREIGRPEQEKFAAEQRINTAHHGTSSGVARNAACHAIVAIFLAFRPAAQP